MFDYPARRRLPPDTIPERAKQDTAYHANKKGKQSATPWETARKKKNPLKMVGVGRFELGLGEITKR